MGEALITRRGGFDITSLGECEVYKENKGGSITGGQFTIPDTIDLADIKVMYFVVSGCLVIFTMDGTVIYDETEGIDITITDRTIKYNKYNVVITLYVFY
jgi:hypothetical protein